MSKYLTVQLCFLSLSPDQNVNQKFVVGWSITTLERIVKLHKTSIKDSFSGEVSGLKYVYHRCFLGLKQDFQKLFYRTSLRDCFFICENHFNMQCQSKQICYLGQRFRRLFPILTKFSFITTEIELRSYYRESECINYLKKFSII